MVRFCLGVSPDGCSNVAVSREKAHARNPIQLENRSFSLSHGRRSGVAPNSARRLFAKQRRRERGQAFPRKT
jgi:hypothetical protein